MNKKTELLKQLQRINQEEEEKIGEEIYRMIDLIVEKRKSLNLSQLDLSRISGIPQTTISRIETKTTLPNLITLYKICNSLDLTIRIE